MKFPYHSAILGIAKNDTMIGNFIMILYYFSKHEYYFLAQLARN